MADEKKKYSEKEQGGTRRVGVERRAEKRAQRRAKERERLAKESRAEQIDFSDIDVDPGAPVYNMKKGKRRMRRHVQDFGYSCLSALMYGAFVLGLSLFLAGTVITCANEVFAFVQPDRSAIVELGEDSSPSEVAETLKEADIIKYPFLFKLYCSVSGAEFQPGTYELNRNLDYSALKRIMSGKRGTTRETVWVTIPEGFTVDQIVETLAEKKVCSAEDLYKEIAEGEFDYEFLEGVNENVKYRLEGYLFPDTYQFYVGDDPNNVLCKFLNNFKKQFTDKLRNKAEERGLTVNEIITIASMIEREAKLESEQAIIASVIYNRYFDQAAFPYLNIDATIQYVVGHAPTAEDLTIDDPYNTYLYKGLPPGAIANPGIAAITAAVYPENTGYYYYVARSNGSHIFSRTLAEHNEAINTVRAESGQ